MRSGLIEWDEGWNCIQNGITNLKRTITEGLPSQGTSQEYMKLYTTIFNMCSQKPPYDHSQRLYEKYRETLEEYNTSTVLPSLKEKHGEIVLQDFVKSWENYKVMVRCLSSFFSYLDRYFIHRRSLPTLNDVGLNSFYGLVYREVNVNVRVAAIGLINKEREGEQIDRALLKNVINVFVEIDMGQMDAYEKDFEGYMLLDTCDYYSLKASRWIFEDSYTDYMLKADECLRRERDRISHYLHRWSERKLVEIVKHSLLVVYATQLIEKQPSESGCGALLAADNVEELSRKFIGSLTLDQVPAEGSAFFQNAEDDAMQE